MNWISLEEQYPKEHTGVLVTDGKNVWSAIWFQIGNSKIDIWSCHGFGGYDMEPEFGVPTHWADLPEPPSNLTKRAAD